MGRKLIKNGERGHKLNFPDEHVEVYSEKKLSTSKFIGVSYFERDSKWCAQRWNKSENKHVYKGCYDDEETAAHASDTLARKLMENSEQKLKLNFPDDHTEIYPDEKRFTSKFIGVSFDRNNSKWKVQRWSTNDNKRVHNGYYDDEETAAHASDNLARKLVKNGEQKLKLNFPDDHTEAFPEKMYRYPRMKTCEKNTISKYIGVSYKKENSKWYVQRWSQNDNKRVSNGCYSDKETAAHASDTLARKLMENGEQKLKLNFPDDHTEVYPAEQKKRKRPNNLNLGHSQIN